MPHRALTPAAPATLAAAGEAARAYRAQTRSPRTREAYRGDIDRFCAWCHTHGVDPRPPTPASTVAAYLADLAQQGRAVATIERALSAISTAHASSNHRSPRECAEVRETMAGIRRAVRVGTRRKKRGFLGAAVVGLVDGCPATARGTRNRALILLGWHAALRPSELVALDVADVVDDGLGGLWIALRVSKTDQEGRGRRVHVPAGPAGYCPVRTLAAWLRESGITAGPIFRAVRWDGTLEPTALTTRSLLRLLVTLCKRTGLDPTQYGAHSLRRGLVTAAALDGRAAWEIMRKTGHTSETMVRTYIDEAAAQFRDVAEGLLQPTQRKAGQD